MPGLAALLWIKLPGESDGICGGETTFMFSPTQHGG
jgi:endoglucanase